MLQSSPCDPLSPRPTILAVPYVHKCVNSLSQFELRECFAAHKHVQFDHLYCHNRVNIRVCFIYHSVQKLILV